MTGGVGVNYPFYAVPQPGARIPGVIANWPSQKEVIQGQLQQMRANGCTRLRLPIEHIHDAGDDGFAVSSTGGQLAGVQLDSFCALLAAIKTAGFSHLEVAFFPTWTNDPRCWQSPGAWNTPGYGTCFAAPQGGTPVYGPWYQENWNFVVNVRALLVAAGLPFVLDLNNEGITPGTADYARRLWVDYGCTFGTADTIGLSVVPTLENLAVAPSTWNGNPPWALDVHIYNNMYSTFMSVVTWMRANGLANAELHVGECFYNDPVCAQQFQQGIAHTGKAISALTSWPLTDGGTGVANVVPLACDAYASL